MARLSPSLGPAAPGHEVNMRWLDNRLPPPVVAERFTALAWLVAPVSARDGATFGDETSGTVGPSASGCEARRGAAFPASRFG